MQNYKIPRKEILKLYESCLNEVSAHSVGQWLKAATEKQFVVIPIESVEQIIDYSVNLKEFSDELTHVQEELQNWL